MHPLLLLFIVLVGSYLLGAIPFGYLVARWRGVDILQEGSGNIGATNVGRVLGRKFGLIVFLFDFGKGAVPVAIGQWLSRNQGTLVNEVLWPNSLSVGAGLAAFFGHVFPVYLKFRGGKGVATGAGVVSLLLPWPTFFALIAWVTVLCIGRFVSLASIVAVIVLCLVRIQWCPEPFSPDNRLITGFCFAALGLVILRHRANIGRLLNGNENKIRETPTMNTFVKMVHVLALGLWFGSVIFFVPTTLRIFQAFEELGVQADRPAWVPLPETFTKENGTQLAGIAVSPLFDFYYPLQTVCAFLAAGTALALARSEPAKKIHKVRSALLLLALLSVGFGWPLGRKVGELRIERYDPRPTISQSARESFGRMHAYSLILNFVTIGLVTASMGMAAKLPQGDHGNFQSGNGKTKQV